MKPRAFWALMAVVVAVGLVRLYGPLSTIRGQSVRMAQLRATRAGLLAQEADLESYKQFLATEAGREGAARRMGYLRPGERRLVFVQEKTSKGTAKGETTSPEAGPRR